MQLETKENLKRGMTPDEARRQAVLSFGGLQRLREEMRDGRGLRRFGELVQNTRYALLMIRHELTFAVSVIVTLALAIGERTGVFTIVRRAAIAHDRCEFKIRRHAGWHAIPAIPVVTIDISRGPHLFAVGGRHKA